jgi:hypothetical protein
LPSPLIFLYRVIGVAEARHSQLWVVFPLFVFCLSEEAPVLVSGPSEVPILHPSFAFCRVSPPCPSPQGVEDGRIDMGKGFLGRGVSVKVCPSPYCGIECGNQPVCRGLFVILDDFSEVRKERFHVLFRRACKEFPVVLTYTLSEKVESILNVRYLGFRFREFQSSFTKKIGDEEFDFRFQYLFGDSCNNEVVTVPHQVDLLVHAFKCFRARMGVLLAKYPFQSVQRHIGKDRTAYTSYKVANMVLEFSTSIPRAQLRPGYGDGFLGAPLQTDFLPEQPPSQPRGGRRGTSSTPTSPHAGDAHHV